jgi:CRP/FNR family transcriptional regulator
MKVIDVLAATPLFAGLPDAQLNELATIAVDQTFKRGQSLFSEGSEATGFYVIASGKIKIYKLSLEGKEQILHIFGAGEFFGEVPVFAGGRYPAHAEALEPSRVLFIPKAGFFELIQKQPSLATNMLAILSLRLKRFTHLIEDPSLKEVPGRLAAYLLLLGERQPNAEIFDLDITKGQLAALLGTIPETLSRILSRMSQLRYIEVDGRKITILDREALESLSAGEKLAG